MEKYLLVVVGVIALIGLAVFSYRDFQRLRAMLREDKWTRL